VAAPPAELRPRKRWLVGLGASARYMALFSMQFGPIGAAQREELT
jgi:hypothetical protein